MSPPSTASSGSPRRWRSKSRRHGITVNCISPGYVWTPLVERQIPDTMKARSLTKEQVINDVLLEAQPTKQFVTVEQVAALAVFLCSDAASQITGRQPVHGRRLDGAMSGRGAAKRERAAPAGLAGPKAREDRLAGPAGRRRPRRLHVGRARRAPRGRAPGHRGDHRRQRRRHERRRHGRRLARGRRRRRARAARDLLAAGQPRRLAVAGAARPFRPASSASGAAHVWTDMVRARFSPYETNPLNINPLRDAIDDLIDFEQVRACDGRPVSSSPRPMSGPARSPSSDGEELTADHLMASACLPTVFQAVEIDGRALLGRRLHGQSGAVSAVLRDGDRRYPARADQSGRAPGDAAHGARDPEPAERDHLQRQPPARVARRSSSSPG